MATNLCRSPKATRPNESKEGTLTVLGYFVSEGGIGRTLVLMVMGTVLLEAPDQRL